MNLTGCPDTTGHSCHATVGRPRHSCDGQSVNVFPPNRPRPTSSVAERSLHDAFTRCPLPWTVFHSLRLRSRGGWEGEGDFVIADPAAGLLVLEVKGGAIEERGGLWFQNGRALERPPRDQGLAFVKRLVADLRAAGIEAPPFGVATAFPDCDFSAPPSNGDLRDVVLGRRDLSHLEHALPAVFRRAVPEGRAPANRRWLTQLQAWWGETWVPTVTLTDRVEDAAQKAVALDAQQYALLEIAGDNPRALVEGPAGSGKTLVATELCRRRARAGLHTLYVCFTDALARAVQAQFLDASLPEPRPRAISIRQLAVDLLRKTGAAIPPPDKAFWDQVSFAAAVDALPPEPARPHVVVVDEGQDFETSDWMLVEQLAGQRGLWVFRDLRQAFWSDRTLPESISSTLATKLKLQVRYRCPPGLSAFAEHFATQDAPTSAPSPDDVRVVPCASADTAERVRHLVEELRRGGARPGDIAILSLAGQTRSELYKLRTLGSTRLVHADDPAAKENVVVETFLRFKGLERPFVILCETSGAHLTHFATRMYIGLTRATVQAQIVAAPDVLALPQFAWVSQGNS
jgi:hypothetical protein